MQLDDLLAEAAAAGTVESRGGFRVDLQAAIEKRRSYQVENAHHYVNRLLRAAYRSGAHSVEILSSGIRTRVRFHSLALPCRRLEHLLEELFQNYGSAANELAEAANLAFGIEDAQVELRLDDGENCKVMVRDKVRAEVFEAASQSLPSTTFQLTRGGSALVSSFGVNSPEYLAIVRRFRFSPLQIRINNESPPRDKAWGNKGLKWMTSAESVVLKKSFFSLGERTCSQHHGAELRVFGESPGDNGIGLPPSRAGSLATLGARYRVEDFDCCRIAVGLCADPKQPSKASWVYSGETLQVFPVELSLPGVQFVLDASDLNLDASRERLVQDDAFQARWEEAKGYFEMMREALAETYGQASDVRLARCAHFDEENGWVKRMRKG